MTKVDPLVMQVEMVVAQPRPVQPPQYDFFIALLALVQPIIILLVRYHLRRHSDHCPPAEQ